MYCQYLLKCVFTAQKPAFMIEDKKQDGIKYLASREHAVLINIFVEYRIDKIGPPQTVNPGISEKKDNLDKSTNDIVTKEIFSIFQRNLTIIECVRSHILPKIVCTDSHS